MICVIFDWYGSEYKNVTGRIKVVELKAYTTANHRVCGDRIVAERICL